jgi:small subunit ribosomal protein S6
MHNYELIFILHAALEEASLNTAVDNVETLIKNNGGEIAKIDRWGKRKLAYPINKTNEVYYVLVDFNYQPDEVAGLKRTLGYNEQVLRYIVVRKA